MPPHSQKDLLGNPIKRRRPRYEASLEKVDRDELPQRAERVRWLQRVIPRNSGYGMPFETYFVFEDARSSFVYGQFVATVVLAASFIEHWFSANLSLLGYEKAGNAGLAAAVACARDYDLVPAVVLDKVDRLRLIRNPFVHLKQFDHPHSIGRRSLAAKEPPAETLEKDAKEALITMYATAAYAFRR